MSYKALYLTYRPQTFEEVAGQKTIVRTLTNALSSGKIAHAYLFAGPRGTGKTTMARLFAKALNCEEGIGHQCNKCSNCIAVSEGTHPDVIEIDAASNNGVDQVRDLIDKVKYAPLKGRYKVYIIDEVHMMSTGAFNALLKTLEEPPENVIFILCTTEPYKVIPTILSRCQRFDFGKLTNEEMSQKLKEVLAKEKAEYDENGLKAIIRLADGGMRDALSILDQVLAYSGNKFCEKDVLTLYGLTSIDEKIDLLTAIRHGEVKLVLEKTNSYLASGVDVRRLVSDLIAILKDLLIYEKTRDDSLMDNLDKEEAISLSGLISPNACNDMIASLIEAQNDFKNVSDVRSLFELTLLKMTSHSQESKESVHEEKKIVPAEKEIKPVAQEQVAVKPAPAAPIESSEVSPKSDEAPKTSPATPTPVTPTSVEPPSFLFEDENNGVKEKEQAKTASEETIDVSKILSPNIATEGPTYSLPDEEMIKMMVLASKSERTTLVRKWKKFDSLRGDPKIGNLATLLIEGHPYCLCKEAIILSYNFPRLKEKANIIANQEPLEELLETILGRKVFVYAIDPIDRSRIMQTFYNLQTVNKLPRKDDVSLNLPKR